MSDHVEMKPDNFGDKREDELLSSILAESEDVIIWYDTNLEGKTIFVNVGNATVSMPEHVFYTLTKFAQAATKQLLNLD